MSKTEQPGFEGLSSLEALRKLVLCLKSLDVSSRKLSNPSLGNLVLKTLSSNVHSLIHWRSIVLGIVFGILLLTAFPAFDQNGRASLVIFEGIFVLCVTLANFVLAVREEWLRKTEITRKLQNIIYHCNELLSMSHVPLYLPLLLPASSSMSLIPAIRDGRLVNLPVVLLVEGDVIVLPVKVKAPAKIVRRNQVFGKGDMVEDDFDNERSTNVQHCDVKAWRRFRVEENVVEDVLKEVLRKSEDPPGILSSEKHKFFNDIFFKWLIWMLIALSFLVNLIRYLVVREDVAGWPEMLYLQQIYTVLPVFPLLFPIFWLTTRLFGLSSILSRCLALTIADFPPVENSGESTQPITSSSGEEVPLTSNAAKWRLFLDLLKGKPDYLPRTSSLLEKLGNVSVLCCADKEGILCSPSPYPNQVFFFGPSEEMETEETADSEQDKLSEQESEKPANFDSENRQEEDLPKAGVVQVLDVSIAPQEESIVQFDDPRWRENMTSLKPLGLNVLLNSTGKSLPSVLWRESYLQSMSDERILRSPEACLRYLFLLGKEIGFTSSGLSSFNVKFTMTTFTTWSTGFCCTPSQRDKETFSWQADYQKPRMMVAQVVEDANSKTYQLMSRGPADLLLSCCSDYWNGEELKSLSKAERRKILDFYRRLNLTAYCVALAYRPLDDTLGSLDEDVYIEMSAECWEEKLRSFTSSPEGSVFIDTASPEPQTSVPTKGCTFESKPPQMKSMSAEACYKMEKGQIFIGMVSLQYMPMRDTVKLVEDLQTAGIRFVYFSAENELRSKVLSEKMGLETGWNCHISLASGDDVNATSDVSSSDEELSLDDAGDSSSVNSDYQLPYGTRNQARLPRGIHNVRPHLEKVDNVPLLVSLFTDCTAPDSCEMVKIMQDYGEIVCCVSSALNADNSRIFSQADVSFGLEPLYPLPYTSDDLFGEMKDDLSCLKTKSASESRYLVKLACSIISLPCSLTFHREDNVRLVQLIQEARRFCALLRQCFFLFFSCNLSISVVFLLSSLFLLPPPLTGVHVLWLTCVTTPVLSLSLLTVPVHKIMTSLTSKNTNHAQNMKRFSLYCALRFIPSSFIVVLCFALNLNSLCKADSLEACHPLMGLRNASGAWNGWGTKRVRSFAFAQDVNAFLLCVYFVFASLSSLSRVHPFWKIGLRECKSWIVGVTVCLGLQCAYFGLSSLAWSHSGSSSPADLSLLPVSALVVAFIWPFLSLLIHELVKRHDRECYIRNQKRRRLEFHTKLGMNSPV
eukprot:m.1516 g.1516  ORF g.1516 m.1516 type:complete len:1254 (+) comp7013_c0_seq1:20-3781(+)